MLEMKMQWLVFKRNWKCRSPIVKTHGAILDDILSKTKIVYSPNAFEWQNDAPSIDCVPLSETDNSYTISEPPCTQMEMGLCDYP
jgi:hypothetical protein